jgi:lichenan operon transcriptional antiterminator
MGYIFTNRQEKIIRLLLECDGYINSLSIAEMLVVSDKTVRTDIVMINNQFIIPIIDVQKGRGYYIADKSRCIGYLLGKVNQEGRRELLILKEILSNDTVDYYNLSDSFFISNSTLDKEVYLLNKMIATYYSELQIKRKNNRLLVEGEDRQKRELLAFFLLLELDNNKIMILIIFLSILKT